MKKLYFQLLSVLFLLSAAIPAQAQESKIMQVHSGGGVVYEIPTAQVDSVVFRDEGVVFPRSITPVVVGKGDDAPYTTNFNRQENYVIKTLEEWDDLLANFDYKDKIDKEIDFSKYQVIVIYDRIHLNGGWSIDVTDIEEYADDIIVTVENLRKGALITLETRPFLMIKIPASNKSVIFKSNTIVDFVWRTNVSLPDNCIDRQNLETETVYLVNSAEELSAHLSCGAGDIPEIDFDNYSLIIVFGETARNILYDGVYSTLFQLALGEYELEMSIYLGMEETSGNWSVIIETSKLPDNAKITLNLKKKDTSVCGVNDPLQGIEWLREYCENFNETQDFSSVHIHLYKIIGSDEHVFKIVIRQSNFDYSPFLYSEYWKNCLGEHIFNVHSGTPPMPGVVEAFMEDKEFVAELFHIVR